MASLNTSANNLAINVLSIVDLEIACAATPMGDFCGHCFFLIKRKRRMDNLNKTCVQERLVRINLSNVDCCWEKGADRLQH